MPITNKRNWLLPLACGLLAALALTLVLVIVMQPEAVPTYRFEITDGALRHSIESETTDPKAVLAAAGIDLGAGDTVEINQTEDGTDLTIRRSATVTITAGGETQSFTGYEQTVGQALEQLGIRYDEDDRLDPSAETPLEEGMAITLVRMEYQYQQRDEVLPMEVIETVDTTLGADEIVVDAEGSDGLQRTTTMLTFEDGFLIDKSEQVETIVEPVARVVRKGVSHAVMEGSKTLETIKLNAAKPGTPNTSSKPDTSYQNSSPVSSTTGGVLTTASGQTYTYTQVLACSATAYTTDGFAEKHNASGNIARVGTVAVDPKVIPLGTALYIVTDDGEYIYGYCIAEDTGGAVKGNIVDLFFDTLEECYAFGRRNCTVYVLG